MKTDNQQTDIDALRKAYSDSAGNVESGTLLAQAYADRGWLNQATDIYVELLQKVPDNYGLLLDYGNVCARRQNFRDAASSFKRLTTLKPDRIEGWNNLGIALLQTKNFDAAFAAFSRVLLLEPKNAGALLNLGNYYDRKGDVEKAIECFDASVKAQPDFADGWFNLGNANMSTARFSEAIEAYRRALRYAPEFGSAMKNLGFAYEQTGDYENAIIHYCAALNYNRTDPALYVNIANIYLRQKRFYEAKDYYTRAVHISARCTDGWLGVRHCAHLTGDIAAYFLACMSVIADLPAHEIAISCALFRKIRNWEKLDALIESADRFEKKGDDLDAERLLAYQRRSVNSDRITSISKRLRSLKKPSDSIRLCLAYFLLLSGEHGDTLEILEPMSSINYEVVNIRSLALHADGMTAQADRVVSNFLQSNPDYCEGWFLKALFASRNGDEAAAEAALKRALFSGYTDIGRIKQDPVLAMAYEHLVHPRPL